ncbi:hypothetical protein ACTXT7_011356 [Hymenolepis weldensis]
MISKLGSVAGDKSSLFNLTVSLIDFALVSDLVLSKKTNSDVSFSFFFSDLLAMLSFNSDFSPTWIIYPPKGFTPHPTLIRRISGAVTPKVPILRGTLLSTRLKFRRRRCQNGNENSHKEGFYRESSTNSSTRQNSSNKRVLTQTTQRYGSFVNVNSRKYLNLSINDIPSELQIDTAVRFYLSMRCGATFLEKTTFKECYVTDQNISLVNPDWVDELNLIRLLDEKNTSQSLTLEPTNAKNLVRGCN